MATIPTYRKRLAPAGLMTRRQLRAAGLRPAGHDPVAQLRYYRHGWQHAYLYDATLARPVRPMTPGRRRTLDAMMRARRTCPTCRTVRDYCIPKSLGCCLPCHETEDERMTDDQTAYATAPDLMRESGEVMRLSKSRAEQAGTDHLLTAVQEREYLLRRAALSDRFALEDPTENLYVTDAQATAEQLLDFDMRHPDLSRGPANPDPRAYVRQEYKAWSRSH